MAKKKALSKPSKGKRVSSSAQSAKPGSNSGETQKNRRPFAAPETEKSTQVSPKPSTPMRAAAAKPGLPAEAAMSFLRDTKGSLSWTLRDLSHTLNISHEEAARVVALLQIQGYVQQEAHKSGEWITPPAGATVSGAKAPRFDRETVEGALTSLKQRILDANKDSAGKFRITRAVAFGDFLAKDRARVQAADAGIELARKDRERTSEDIAALHSAVEAREEQNFLRQLRGRSALINLKPIPNGWGLVHTKNFSDLASEKI